MPETIIDYRIEIKSALDALQKLNQGFAGNEKQVKAVSDIMDKLQNGLVSYSDKSTKLLLKQVDALEKQANALNKTPVQKYTEQQEKMIANIRKSTFTLEEQEKQIKRVTASYQQLIDAAGGGNKFQAFGDGVKNFIQNPMQGAGSAAEGLLGKLGPLGIGLSAGAGAVAAYGVAAFNAAKSLGELGDSIEDTANRLGISKLETQKVSYAMKLVGGDVSTLEGVMKKLSTEIETGGEKLTKLGIRFRDVNTGEVLPILETTKQLIERWKNLSVTMRTFEAKEFLGKEAVAGLPDLLEMFDKLQSKQVQQGLYHSDKDIAEMSKAQAKIAAITHDWDFLVAKMKAGIAVPFMWYFTKPEEPKGTFGSSNFKLQFDPNDKFAGVSPEFRAKMAQVEADKKAKADQQAKINEQEIIKNKAANDLVLGSRLEDRLAEAKKKLSEIHLSDNVTLQAGEKTRQEYKDQLKVVEALEKRVEAERKLKSLQQAFPEHMLERQKALAVAQAQKYTEDSPVAKAIAEYKKVEAEGKAAIKEDLKYRSESLNHLNEEIAAQNKLNAGIKVALAARKEMEDNQKAQNAFDKFSIEESQKKRSGLLNLFSPSKEQQKDWMENFQADQQISDIGLQSTHSAISQRAAIATRLAEMKSGPNQERDLIEQIRNIRLQMAAEVRDADLEHASREENLNKRRVDQARALADYQRETNEANNEAVIRTLEVQKREFDAIKSKAQDLVHTLFVDPKNFGGQLKTTLRDAALKPIEEGIATTIAGPIQQLFGKSNRPVGTRDNPSFTYVLNSGSGVPGVGGGANIPLGGFSPIGPNFSPGGALGSILPGISSGAPITTPPIFGGSVGSPGGGFGSVGGIGNFKTILQNFKSLGGLGGFTRGPGQGGDFGGEFSKGKITGVNGLAGTALLMGGSMLAQHGLIGASAGTWSGAFQGAAGGAMIGMKFGGPLGAGIGAGVGFLAGVGEKIAGVESKQNQAKRLVQAQYGMQIDDALASQIAGIAQSKFGGHVSMAVRDPEVRQILELYAAGSGQRMPLSSSSPRAGGLEMSGGKLYQSTQYVHGSAYVHQSNLPVAGGGSYNTFPSSGNMSLQINVAGKGAADFMAGSVVTPEFVTARFQNSQQMSNGRVWNSAITNSPGLITG